MQATALSPDNKPRNRRVGLADKSTGTSGVASFQGDIEHEPWHN